MITAESLYNTKIRVNHSNSKAVHEKLWELGFLCGNGEKDWNINEQFIFIYSAETADGFDQYRRAISEKWFLNHRNREIYPNQLLNDYDYIRPNHYKQADGKETIDLMIDEFGVNEVAIFCKINAFKYVDRKGKKPGEDEARESAKQKWYQDKAEELYATLKQQK